MNAARLPCCGTVMVSLCAMSLNSPKRFYAFAVITVTVVFSNVEIV
jgi:hypothetical protein